MVVSRGKNRKTGQKPVVIPPHPPRITDEFIVIEPVSSLAKGRFAGSGSPGRGRATRLRSEVLYFNLNGNGNIAQPKILELYKIVHNAGGDKTLRCLYDFIFSDRIFSRPLFCMNIEFYSLICTRINYISCFAWA
jgi:hypothetical protein